MLKKNLTQLSCYEEGMNKCIFIAINIFKEKNFCLLLRSTSCYLGETEHLVSYLGFERFTVYLGNLASEIVGYSSWVLTLACFLFRLTNLFKN